MGETETVSDSSKAVLQEERAADDILSSFLIHPASSPRKSLD
jgi:hypothetical protein